MRDAEHVGPVWLIAAKDGRNYITPEDVTTAIETGATKDEVWLDVLQAVEAKSVEDASCTAFVALKMKS